MPVPRMISRIELARRLARALQINRPPPEPEGPFSRLKRKLEELRRRLPGGKPRAVRFGRNWRLIGGAVVALVAVGALLAYSSLKRPGDILNRDAEFDPFEAKVTRGVVDWPTYGFNNAKVRYLPRKGIRPPFKRRWEFTSGALMEFSPILVRSRIFGVNNAGLAFSLDAKSGKTNWTRKIGTLNASSPAFSDGRLFVVNLEPGQIQALDVDNGRQIWKRELPGRSESSPVVEDGRVVFGCECGILYALDQATGKTIWQRDLGSAIKGGPAIDNGIAYVGDYGGTLSAVNLDDGSIKWQSSSQGLSLGRTGSFYATPAVAFGRVYIGSKDSRMYSFEAETGKVAWSHSTGSELYASAALADTVASPPTVYFGGLDGKVYALDAKTGEERWVKDAGGSVIGAGAVIGQIYYVANVSKRATAGFSTMTGKRVFGDDFGAYNTPISDGKQIYFSTYAGIVAMKVKPGGSQTKAEKRAEKAQKEKAANRAP
ncbi:MAG: PQQ-binding-like beta-propeller repeat protein [Solirubrobacterales bacterium]